jgi:hypothetical protein
VFSGAVKIRKEKTMINSMRLEIPKAVQYGLIGDDELG